MQKDLSKQKKCGEFQTTSNKEARELEALGFMCERDKLDSRRTLYTFEDSIELEAIRREKLYGDEESFDICEISPIQSKKRRTNSGSSFLYKRTVRQF